MLWARPSHVANPSFRIRVILPDWAQLLKDGMTWTGQVGAMFNEWL